jgi:hypothetical protein
MKPERRSISTSFVTDPEVERMSHNVKTLFAFLLFVPENNMAGVYEITTRKLSFYLDLPEPEVCSALEALLVAGKVFRFKDWIAIKNHIKNQKISNGNMAIAIVKDLCRAPKEVKLWLFYKNDETTLEPWITLILTKVNDYFRQQRERIVRKNTANGSLTHTERFPNGYPTVTLTEGQLINIMVQDLPVSVDDISNYYNILTVLHQQGNPSMKVEGGSMKGKGEIEVEVLEGGSKQPLLLPDDEIPFPPVPTDYNARFEIARDAWNGTSGLPGEKRLLATCAEVIDIKTVMDTYSDDEISKSIKNYHDDLPEPKYRYKSFVTFLVKGVHNHHDKADKAKPQYSGTQEEMRERYKGTL